MSATEAPLLRFEGVAFSYPDGERVLDGISFDVAHGERVVVLGANGCGKSTLLKLADGLLFADFGTVGYRGTVLDRAGLSRGALRRDFRGSVGLVFQHPEAMLFNPSVLEEIAYGPRRLGRMEPEALARDWARRLGLERHLDRAPFKLSGGEKQRLALACVLACEPRLLLLDEPTANLDPRAIGWLIDHLAEAEELAVITTTQNLALAAELGQRALVMSEAGSVLFDGPLDAAIRDRELLLEANLAHRHLHEHADGSVHRHLHSHPDWS
ncbi:MAG: ABC transporter [Gammaproteobacteria bacterium HGW-Gammaproteobacteria-8]|nr:MAG: ABC transporter [Gammaproteobacteria bacterium HGW-Gammaproteobacteria-8]